MAAQTAGNRRANRTEMEPGAGPWIVLLPGARWDNKRWPVEHFVELARLMRGMGALQFVILGGGDDRALGRGHRGGKSGPLPESGGANVVVGNDRMGAAGPAGHQQRHGADACGGGPGQAVDRPLWPHQPAEHRALRQTGQRPANQQPALRPVHEAQLPLCRADGVSEPDDGVERLCESA